MHLLFFIILNSIISKVKKCYVLSLMIVFLFSCCCAGLGNYQQQESSYGPARTSFSSDASGGYSSYGASAEQTGYGPGAYGGGENFGRGTTNVSRGFHPYGR